MSRVVAAAIVIASCLALSGCVANTAVIGLTVVHGKTAMVVSLCPGERVSEVATFHGNANGTVTTTWELAAKPPQPGVLFFIGMPRAKFTTKIPLAVGSLHPDEQGSVTVDSPYWHGIYLAGTSDDFGKAKPGSVLVNGSYITYGTYMADYQLCKQQKRNTSSKGLFQ
jgi:phage-related tail fiber protein